jgi:hypothetical protein
LDKSMSQNFLKFPKKWGDKEREEKGEREKS